MSSELTNFFLNSPRSVVQFETIELSHPSFSKVYRFVRNNSNGITAGLENAGGQVVFEFLPMRMRREKLKANLDFSLIVELGDVGQIFPQEMDAVKAGADSTTRPSFVYRTYRSDDLSNPLSGPIKLEVSKVTFNKSGIEFEAVAKASRLSKTGEVYSRSRFIGLKYV